MRVSRYCYGSSTAPPLSAERFAQFREDGPHLERSAEVKSRLIPLIGHVSHGQGEGIQPFEHGDVLLFTGRWGALLSGLWGRRILGLARAAVHCISIHDAPFDHIEIFFCHYISILCSYREKCVIMKDQNNLKGSV